MLGLKLKYIRTVDNHFLIFSETLNHSSFKELNPISAGFVSFQKDFYSAEVKAFCHGNSVSLGLTSLNTDTETMAIRLSEVQNRMTYFQSKSPYLEFVMCCNCTKEFLDFLNGWVKFGNFQSAGVVQLFVEVDDDALNLKTSSIDQLFLDLINDDVNEDYQVKYDPSADEKLRMNFGIYD